MGLQPVDPGLHKAHNGGKFTTPSGIMLDGSKDTIEDPRLTIRRRTPMMTVLQTRSPPASSIFSTLPAELFQAATMNKLFALTRAAEFLIRSAVRDATFPNLKINRDRRVADVETVFDSLRGDIQRPLRNRDPSARYCGRRQRISGIEAASISFLYRQKHLYRFQAARSRSKLLRAQSRWNGSERIPDQTTVGSKKYPTLWPRWAEHQPHDGVIFRHGGEARDSARIIAKLPALDQRLLLEFLDSLVIFPPDDPPRTWIQETQKLQASHSSDTAALS